MMFIQPTILTVQIESLLIDLNPKTNNAFCNEFLSANTVPWYSQLHNVILSLYKQ